ncbi:GNAT family N-acetyltransferase [Candidatus Thorarchaeota archaeon]|nr:MAG: GNAT family N-acetyltransferase [Candidatus Thorarchaeota archaeon]
MSNIRRLRESDKEDILEIARNTWDGHDYVPKFFDSWLKDIDSYPVGIEDDGHIIALANLRVIDDGKTGWMEALRVHPSYRGKGLATILTQHIVQLAMNIPVKRIRYTTAVSNKTSLHLAESVGMRRKFTLAGYWQDNPTEISWRSSSKPLFEANASDVCQDLIDAKLLPFNIIICDWKALDATPEGLAKVDSLSQFWIQKKAGKVTSFSLSLDHDDVSDKQWTFTIYAKDVSGFLDHLSHHVKMASETKSTSIFGLFEPEYLETFHNLEWDKQTKYEIEEMSLTLLERIL